VVECFMLSLVLRVPSHYCGDEVFDSVPICFQSSLCVTNRGFFFHRNITVLVQATLLCNLVTK
jgi:hypothetical protein